MNPLFFFNSILLGAGLAMDAFAVSLANGLAAPQQTAGRSARIAGIFALFQTAMPLIGWACVHAASEAFLTFQPLIPWIALALLVFLGIRMILEGRREQAAAQTERTSSQAAAASPQANTDSQVHANAQASLRGRTLLAQAVATSIDALSVGFAIARHSLPLALTESVIIGVVTFVICRAGISIGRRVGTRLAGRAAILGGVILIAIGIEIAFL